MPAFDDMLADIGNPSPAALGKALGFSEKTVRAWKAKNEAPKAVMLAIFWITQWGQQWVDADVFNLAQVHMTLSDGLKQALAKEQQETARLSAQIEHLGQLGEFGSANDPVSGVSGPGPSPAQPLALTFGAFDQQLVQHAPASKPGRPQAARARHQRRAA